MSNHKETSVAAASKLQTFSVHPASFHQTAEENLNRAILLIKEMQVALKKLPSNLKIQTANTKNNLVVTHAKNVQKLSEKTEELEKKYLSSTEKVEDKLAQVEADIGSLSNACRHEASFIASEIQKDCFLAKGELKDFKLSLSDDVIRASNAVKHSYKEIHAEVAEKKNEVEKQWSRKRFQWKLEELNQRAQRTEDQAIESISNVLQAIGEAELAFIVALEAQSELEEMRNKKTQ
ncbi:hypothetical protein QQ213_002334 [Vibrio vulnificus]|uniref:hypothetical protein n=2 Tax=Vibrio vulnificus TaxID=672 RepID=UPI0005FBA0D1|nr:hypothetical protein [Vibrio vulnificus]EGR1511544.1 hypothetical protein [Vibrio vulnificus]EHY9869096.1 hypothetical protein [Vibrio vulnificus]EIC2759134.1 hypothetical protein [Vibrio vulnificus]EIV1851825.1 hypothetical protein [Vibrio vulnificus]ELS0752566.1 hypothetical protein [Vibrio vulnificus]